MAAARSCCSPSRRCRSRPASRSCRCRSRLLLAPSPTPMLDPSSRRRQRRRRRGGHLAVCCRAAVAAHRTAGGQGGAGGAREAGRRGQAARQLPPRQRGSLPMSWCWSAGCLPQCGCCGWAARSGYAWRRGERPCRRRCIATCRPPPDLMAVPVCPRQPCLPACPCARVCAAGRRERQAQVPVPAPEAGGGGGRREARGAAEGVTAAGWGAPAFERARWRARLSVSFGF